MLPPRHPLWWRPRPKLRSRCPRASAKRKPRSFALFTNKTKILYETVKLFFLVDTAVA